MARWLLMFMLLAVPFQLAWSSAAPYCAHEEGAAFKQHLGHHAHEHQLGGDSLFPSGDSDDVIGGFHFDCESCHLGCSASVPVTISSLQAVIFRRTSGPPDVCFDSHVPAGPLRPDRA